MGEAQKWHASLHIPWLGFDHVATHNKKEAGHGIYLYTQETEEAELKLVSRQQRGSQQNSSCSCYSVLTYLPNIFVHSLYVLKFLPHFSFPTAPIFFPPQGLYIIFPLKYSSPTFCSASTYLQHPSPSLPATSKSGNLTMVSHCLNLYYFSGWLTMYSRLLPFLFLL